VGSAWVAHRRVTLTDSPWHMPSRNFPSAFSHQRPRPAPYPGK